MMYHCMRHILLPCIIILHNQIFWHIHSPTLCIYCIPCICGRGYYLRVCIKNFHVLQSDLCWMFRCLFNWFLWENNSPHNLHLESLWPWCIMWIWLFKDCAPVNDLPQDSHLKSLYPSWTVCRCLSKPRNSWNNLPQSSHL